MIPHERSLVKRLEREPFALLGVSADQDRRELEKFLNEKQITWPIWWDKGFDGPIVTQWNVRGYPTIYVLDHTGTIRFKNVYGKELDEAIDQLLAEKKKSDDKQKP
jgi:hypothetical protein